MSKNGKKIIIILILTLVSAIAATSLGIAFTGGIRGLGLLGVWFFATFGIVIVLAQLIPAGVLFSSLIGSIFSSLRRREAPVRSA